MMRGLPKSLIRARVVLSLAALSLAVAARAVAAPASAQSVSTAGSAPTDLTGVWDVDVVKGSSEGDTAVLRIATSETGLLAEMVFRDSRAEENAEQSCTVAQAGEAGAEIVTIRCTVTRAYWVPDHFEVQVVSPNRMEGKHISAYSGFAILRRRVEDDLLSCATRFASTLAGAACRSAPAPKRCSGEPQCAARP